MKRQTKQIKGLRLIERCRCVTPDKKTQQKKQQNQIFSTEMITHWHCFLLAKTILKGRCTKATCPVNIPVVHSNTLQNAIAFANSERTN